MTCEMYKYEICGYYWEYDTGITPKYFIEVIEAPDNITAMQIALGRIMLTTKNPIKLDKIHYEVFNNEGRF